MLAKLALKSLLNRKGSVILVVLSMAVSIFVLLGVEHIRHQAKDSFSKTVSGTDLIVGAKTSDINLLLYSVFRTGSPTNNISWRTYQLLKSNPDIAWSIPLSLGDSHKGYRVLGTSDDYFKHFSYGQEQHLRFNKGNAFKQTYDIVLGSDVAKKLKYQLGDQLILSHGIAEISFNQHSGKPFIVVGILAPTGTPVDQTLHVSLESIEAIHTSNDQAELIPESITAIMLGLTSKTKTFKLQRNINNYKKEPLLAILPGVTLSKLWEMIAIVENLLLLVSILIFITTLLGLIAMLLSSMRERRQEIKLLRIIGASPITVFLLIELEALFITLLSITLGAFTLFCCLFLTKDYLISNFGLHIDTNIFSESSLYMFLIIIAASIIVSAIPSIKAFITSKK